ncbi:ATP-dependent DNA ligase [Cellulomonas chitinilytica]|uniref:DNA ligase (ATP) n=1 Tax=Cellulomonas chitinilytica TaxID=398759 RepID=A0A919P7Q4_9CELL|nr:ATP-dependent DNA ligase [Cellulomonas chitinilytica]GIG22484.1 ATP-dependent DNA ligase [Cellulomonas chitinilytica]
MQLPVMPPVAPMLAKSVPQIPDVGHVEPKWDGFRTIVFRDGDEVELGSRNERPMTRYFPEVVEAIKANTPERCVIDGEIILVTGDRLDFDALQQRIHPAESRVRKLSQETPASFVAFDLLAVGDEDLTQHPFVERRARLVEALASASAPIHVTPATADLAEAQDWFTRFEGAGLDGVVAKPLDGTYQPDKRTMFKIKHERTADCVVAGFRWHKTGDVVGSLLLGIWADDGHLQHVGVAASFPMARRKSLLDELAPYRDVDLAEHPWGQWADQAAHAESRMPGAVSRWNAKKDLSFVPLRPELVVEVAYDHMEGDRFRHTAQFRRWRTDRDPRSCTYEQLDEPVKFDLAEILGRH